MDANEVLRELIVANERFMLGANEALRSDLSLRSELCQGQSPVAAILCCSDARVAPEIIFDQPLGRLFVIRAPGNTASQEALAGLEYAVEHLSVPLLMVIGHTGCGAVTAAVQGTVPTGALGAVLLRIQPAVHAVSIDTPDRVNVVATKNVQIALDTLLNQSPTLREAVRMGRTALVGAMYELETGRVRVLE